MTANTLTAAPSSDNPRGQLTPLQIDQAITDATPGTAEFGSRIEALAEIVIPSLPASASEFFVIGARAFFTGITGALRYADPHTTLHKVYAIVSLDHASLSQWMETLRASPFDRARHCAARFLDRPDSGALRDQIEALRASLREFLAHSAC